MSARDDNNNKLHRETGTRQKIIHLRMELRIINEFTRERDKQYIQTLYYWGSTPLEYTCGLSNIRLNCITLSEPRCIDLPVQWTNQDFASQPRDVPNDR